MAANTFFSRHLEMPANLADAPLMAGSDKPKGKKSRIAGAVLGEIAGALFGAAGTGAAAGLQKSPADENQAANSVLEKSTPTNSSDPDRQPGTQRLIKRKLGWRGVLVMFIALLFFIASAVLVAGGFSMSSRGMSSDDILFIWTLAGIFGFVGILLVFLAFKRRAYVDENGAIIAFAVMAEMLGDDGSDTGGDPPD